ncbi:hypothetical protein [Pedobacter cryoconitis]|uniref:Uncharacterized protein n=1 Tax=Pedobacter cryoconitis TaxID=188932 RepID=A0A327RU43_9SPHI|nr:hypothetical protein [Pedobacter cryoconitis]RAJ19881.1 hypothetical protein LY11_05253 [Pedobacter cryoconitis]
MGKRKIIFQDLQLNNNYYNLVWVGKIKKSGDTDQLIAEVRFKEIGPCFNKKNISNDLGFTSKSSLSFEIDAKFLLELTIGSVWKNGRLFMKPDKLYEKFKFTIFKPQDHRPYNSKNIYDNDPIISFEHIKYNNAKFLYLKREDIQVLYNKKLIFDLDFVLIPCIEIARFYFFTSGNMISNLLQKRTGHGELFDRSKTTYNKEKKTAHIRLWKGLAGEDAFLAASICFNTSFRNAATYIGNKFCENFRDLPQDSNNAGFRYINTYIPYNIEMKLDTAGKYIKTRSGKKGFIVYEILEHCSEYFLESLSYHPFHDNSINLDCNPKVVPERIIHSPNMETNSLEIPITGQKNVNSQIVKQSLSTQHRSKYSGAFPLVFRAEKQEQKTRSESVIQKPLNIDEFSTLEISIHNSNSAPAELKKPTERNFEVLENKDGITYDRDSVMKDFELFCQNIAVRNNIEFKFLGNMSATEDIPFSHIAFSNERCHHLTANWCSRKRTAGTKKWEPIPRHLALSEFKTINNENFYLLEIQRRLDFPESYPVLFFSALNYKQINAQDFLTIIKKIRDGVAIFE